MGYACPVCETPQRDAEHLANHLAFTAMLHDDDHRRWLDDRVPEWESLGPDDLAPRVADHAEGTTYEEAFEDTTGEGGRPFGGDPAASAARPPRSADRSLDGDAAEILARAREMTREMLDDSANDPDDDSADEKA